MALAMALALVPTVVLVPVPVLPVMGGWVVQGQVQVPGQVPGQVPVLGQVRVPISPRLASALSA